MCLGARLAEVEIVAFFARVMQVRGEACLNTFSNSLLTSRRCLIYLMDIIFIHGNYPGQFKHLAAGLAQSKKHRVFFLTNRHDADPSLIPGVVIRHFDLHRQPSTESHHYLIATEEAVLKG